MISAEEEQKSNHLMSECHFADLKSMLSAGLATIASCSYDIIEKAVHGKKTMNILCIGHGGGSLPLFLASKIKGENLSLNHSV